MLTIAPAPRPRRKGAPASRIGLAMAGGGPIGCTWEMGALRALEEAVEGLDLRELDVYVGISSGAFIAAGLANRLDTAELCRIFITGDSTEARFRPEDFLRPAVFEYLRRAAGLPRAMLGWLGDVARDPFGPHLSDALLRFGSLVPTGLFDNAAIGDFLRNLLAAGGRSDDFRELRRALFIVAVDLDSGEPVRFGAPGFDHVPISRAIEASSALPGLYPPVEIEGRHYVDGALRRTLHASVALDAGADLVIGVNPLVPIDTTHAPGAKGAPHLADGGLPAVLSQTFRALLQSRAQAGAASYPLRYAGADSLTFQPGAGDVEMFFTNIFSFAQRRHLAEHAYQATRADLRAQRERVAPLLARHGLALRDDVLDDDSRTLAASLRRPRAAPVTHRLHAALDDLDRSLDAARAKPRPRRRRAAKA
jgi:predicted acylesterase/phospholipase RssA